MKTATRKTGNIRSMNVMSATARAVEASEVLAKEGYLISDMGVVEYGEAFALIIKNPEHIAMPAND